jgi:hypothetical protein
MHFGQGFALSYSTFRFNGRKKDRCILPPSPLPEVYILPSEGQNMGRAGLHIHDTKPAPAGIA